MDDSGDRLVSYTDRCFLSVNSCCMVRAEFGETRTFLETSVSFRCTEEDNREGK